MILKSLKIEGFKSFVDETQIDFNRGFTAIVGPNGCGKSNVSDAIRWVIGEQSMKSLRGSGISDLIFNGSGTRKPVNRAEISLTLADLPAGLRIGNVPNISDEIKVTRCYHRSGESEFYINQAPCRLKDITDFLLDVGISPKVLTVIEQGHIQDIITSKPEDRRILIEEAAGILKFKNRKNEALRKLAASRQNLDRISDIVQELGRQAESLKRQAAKAERYKKYQAEIKERSLNLFAVKIRQYQAQLSRVEEELAQQTEQKTEWSTRASTLDNQISNLNLEIEELAAHLNQKREAVHELTGGIAKNEHTVELKQSLVNQARVDTESAEGEIARMNEEITTLAEETETQRQTLETAAEEIQAQEEIFNQRTRALQEQKEVLRELEENMRRGEEEVLTVYHRLSQKKNDLTALQTRRQGLEVRDEKLNQELAETRAQLEGHRVALGEAQAVHAQKRHQLGTLKAQQENLLAQTTQAKETLKNLTDRATAVKEVYITQSSLLTSLKELRSKFEGFHEGVKSLMNNQANGNRLPGLREVLVDVLKTPEEYETAIETVLGEKLQSIVVNSYSDTVEAIRYLRTQGTGRGSFIPLRPKSAPRNPLWLNGTQGVLGKATEFIESRDEYRPILELLLGNVVLVQDLETALHLHEDPQFNGTVVTRSGEMIDSMGVVTGGSVRDNDSGLLGQTREIDEMTRTVEELHTEMETAEADVETQAQTAAALDSELKEIENSRHEAEIAANNSQRDLEQLQKEIQRLDEKLSTLEYEGSTNAHELNDLGTQRESLEQELAVLETGKAEREESLTHLRRSLEEHREALEKHSTEISAIQVDLASLKGKKDNTETEIQRLHLQQENLRQRIARRQDDIRGNADKIAQTRGEIEALEKRILDQVREKDEAQEDLVRRGEALQQKEETLKQWEQEGRALSQQLQELTEHISRFEIQRSEIKIQTAHLEERAFEDFNVTLGEMLNNYNDEIDEAEAEETIRSLKEKVSRMGEVNLAALPDYERTRERYDFLKRQQEDLDESILLLHETVEKINRTTKKRFLETFEKVNENFKSVFSRLFEGGKAELKLCDETNPLETGIEITANPLGKTMQHLSLLSGGEKALTAIALMFSVFKVRPSPFCLLDEVDAPLDEANVIRFQDMLKEMAVNTQFIIITHNQRTMSFADVLYGITMEESGVSKAVSVHFN